MNEHRRPQGIDELNIAEFPLCLLTTRMSDTETIHSEDTIMDRSTGEPVHRKVTVFKSPQYGLPTAEDQDILVGLIQHTKDINQFTSRRVEFSRYRLLQIMGWKDESKYYKRVEESLHRWAQVSILFENSWRDRARAKWTTITAHILDRVEINKMAGRRPNDPDEDIMSWFTWGQDVFNSIQAGNTKSLDLEFYFGLESAMAKRMYRYLDKKFHQTREMKIDLHKLAWDKLGLSRNYKDTAQIKRKLDDAIDELVAQKYLESMPDNDRYEQVTRGQYNVVLVRRSVRPKVQEDIVQESLPQMTPESPIVLKLIEIGIDSNVAMVMGATHKEEDIDKYINFMEWKHKKNPKSVSDKAAWLVQAIRQQFPISPEYIKERKAKKEEAKTSENATREATRKQRERRLMLERDGKIKGFLKEKSSEEIESLTEKGIADMDDDFKANLATIGPRSPVIKMMRHSALEAYVAKVLRLDEVTEESEVTTSASS